MKKKILASILAVATMATCVFSAVACNKETPKDEVASSVQEEMKDSGDFEVEDVTPTPGMRLNVVKAPVYNADGTMAVAEDSYELTATVYPEDAADKTVTYTATWSNASSAWASGKNVNDYVSVTQTTSSLTATVTCKQAFGEAIIVTVTSNSNPSAKATTTLHYRQKLKWLSLEANYGAFLPFYDYPATGPSKESESLTVDFTQDYSGKYLVGKVVGTDVYTREEDLSNVVVTVEITDEFAEVLESLGIPTTISGEEQDSSRFCLDKLPLGKTFIETYGTSTEKKNQIIDAFVGFEGVAYTATVEVPGLYKSGLFGFCLNTGAIATQKEVVSVSVDNIELEF